VTPSRIRENFQLGGFELNQEQLAQLRTRNVGYRTITGIDVFGYDALALGL
jgi:diketogulonate reductase-like aldo/keto reductase